MLPVVDPAAAKGAAGRPAPIISDQDRAFYEKNGYVLLRGVLGPAICNRGRDELWRMMP